MRRTLGVLFVSTLFATAAHAAVTTIEYTGSDGAQVTIAYDDATATATVVGGENDGAAGPYKFDEASNTICSNDAEGKEVCVTFDGDGGEPKVGDTAAFSTNDGRSGTAKVIAVQ